MKRTIVAAAALLVLAGLVSVETQTQTAARATQVLPGAQAVVDRYCATCHNPRVKAGGLALDALPLANAAHDPQTWE